MRVKKLPMLSYAKLDHKLLYYLYLIILLSINQLMKVTCDFGTAFSYAKIIFNYHLFSRHKRSHINEHILLNLLAHHNV